MSNQADVSTLLGGATMLSQQSMTILNMHNVGNAIRDALGVPALNVNATEVFLVSLMVDDSGSIASASNVQAIRDGVNSVVEALDEDAESEGIQYFLRYLNGEIIYPFGPLDTVPMLTTSNYNPRHGTPLFDESVEFLKAIIAKTEEFRQWNIPARSLSLIVTDGHDMHSTRHVSRDVKSIVDDMLATEDHMVAAMGVDDGSGIHFTQIFEQMGIRKEWIYETGPQAGESREDFLRRIRRGFNRFSKSAVRASKSAVNFSQLGGFGTN
jgi:hypothetical protein